MPHHRITQPKGEFAARFSMQRINIRCRLYSTQVLNPFSTRLNLYKSTPTESQLGPYTQQRGLGLTVLSPFRFLDPTILPSAVYVSQRTVSPF